MGLKSRAQCTNLVFLYVIYLESGESAQGFYTNKEDLLLLFWQFLAEWV